MCDIILFIRNIKLSMQDEKLPEQIRGITQMRCHTSVCPMDTFYAGSFKSYAIRNIISSYRTFDLDTLVEPDG